MITSEQLLEQPEQRMRNISMALEKAGSGWKDVVRVRYIFPSVDDFNSVGRSFTDISVRSGP
jgi:enamine deaminase RidA (YjgF/YER057c/UK114 family)